MKYMKYEVSGLSHVGPGSTTDKGIGLVWFGLFIKVRKTFFFAVFSSPSFTFNKFRLLSSSSNEQITEYFQVFTYNIRLKSLTITKGCHL